MEEKPAYEKLGYENLQDCLLVILATFIKCSMSDDERDKKMIKILALGAEESFSKEISMALRKYRLESTDEH